MLLSYAFRSSMTYTMTFLSVHAGNPRTYHWWMGRGTQINGPQEANQNAGTEDIIDAGDSEKEAESAQDYFVLPIWSSYSSTVKRSTAKDAGEAPNKHPDLKTDKKPVDKEDQVFLDELERLKRQEQDANDAAEALRKEFAQETEDLLLQAGAAKTSSTNCNNASTPTLILGEPQSEFLTRSKVTKVSGAYGFSLEDESWVDVMQEELLQFKIQKVWILVDLPYGKKAIGTKWVYKNKKDERGVVVRNKARIFLAFASYMGFIVYQMDVKSAFLYGKIDEEYKSWCGEFEALMKSELTFFLGLQVKQKEDGIFISQDKYVAEILKKFDFVSVKTASTPIETQKPLVKDEEASDVDVHLYRSMIGSLMYLTASRPDIMFAVCACSRFQVTPKTSHLSVVKRIFRYLKGKPKLGLWYPRVSSFDLEAYSDSDYARANLDRKSTIGGCQFLGRRLISWQCKKQTIYGLLLLQMGRIVTAAILLLDKFLWLQNRNNPVYHSKTKHIAIRHHFIRDAYEKKLIQVLKIHTDDNVADLLTKASDVSRESLRRALDGTKALLLPKLFILWLAKVSTDSAKLIPLGKDSTAIETLEKILPRV
ncbi:putative ribonuclease H-like domain-containing protein [Tanacetum coccineum]